MDCKTVTILLRIRVRGHFVMSNTKYHESHYVKALDNPLDSKSNRPTGRLYALKGNKELQCQIFQWCYHTCWYEWVDKEKEGWMLENCPSFYGDNLTLINFLCKVKPNQYNPSKTLSPTDWYTTICSPYWVCLYFSFIYSTRSIS